MNFLFWIVIFSAGAFAQTSYVPSTHLLHRKGYQLNFGADYWSTSKQVDPTNNKHTLQDGEKFTRIQSEIGGYYGTTNEFQVGMGARFRQNSSTFINSSNETATVTSSGFQSTFFSAMYAFKPVKRLQYTLEGLYRYTPYTNKAQISPDEEDLVLGDDGNEYSFGLGVTHSSQSNNYYTLRGGYRRPGKEISSEVYYQLEGAWAWRQFALVAGLDGVRSLNQDAYTDDPDNKPRINTHTTNLYNSINRQWYMPYVGANVALGKDWRLELRASQVVSGRSTDLGTGFGIQLVKRMDNKKAYSIDKSFKAYDIEATVTKVSGKKAYVVLDKGLADNIQKGMKFDLFEFDYTGGNILVAQGTVIQIKTDSAIVKITQHYNVKKEIKEGLVGRAKFR